MQKINAKRIAAIVAGLALSGVPCAHAEILPQLYIVAEVNHADDCFTISDFNGNMLEMPGAEDWMVGDMAAAIVDNHGTGMPADDQILEIRYCGWLDGWADIYANAT